MTAIGAGLGFWAALTGALGWTGVSTAAMLLPLLVVRAPAGATSVPLRPGAARAVPLWGPLRERATANVFVTAGARVGIALTYPAFDWLMDRVGWPSACVICAIGGLLWFGIRGPAGRDDSCASRV